MKSGHNKLNSFFKKCLKNKIFVHTLIEYLKESDFFSTAKLDENTLLEAIDFAECKHSNVRFIAFDAICNRRVTPRCIRKAIASKNIEMIDAGLDFWGLKTSDMLGAIAHKNPKVRAMAACSPSANFNTIKMALKDKSVEVRIKAAYSKSIVKHKSLVLEALNDRSVRVRVASICNMHRASKSVGNAITRHCLTHKCVKVRAIIAEKSEFLTENQWNIFMSDANSEVRKAARKHEKAEKWSDPIRVLIRKAKASQAASKMKKADG